MAAPPFAKDFPADARLDALVADFDAGNYARMRKGAKELLAASPPEDVRRAVEELVKRTKPDPMVLLFMGLTALLLVVLTLYWELHGHAR